MVRPCQANYIQERRWAKDQTIMENEDGSLILEMQTSGFQDVKRWVLSFGPHAKVLEPASLVEEIEADIREQVKSYNL